MPQSHAEARSWKWNQKYVADQMETKQPRFSLMEKPGYGNFSLNTLKRLAAIFNVGLIVSFVSFGEMIDFTDSFSRKRLAIPSFADEYKKLERRYCRNRVEQQSTQESFSFTASTAEKPYVGVSLTPTVIDVPNVPLETDNWITGNTNLYFTQRAGA